MPSPPAHFPLVLVGVGSGNPCLKYRTTPPDANTQPPAWGAVGGVLEARIKQMAALKNCFNLCTGLRGGWSICVAFICLAGGWEKSVGGLFPPPTTPNYYLAHSTLFIW
jgi:hypothetical protein